MKNVSSLDILFNASMRHSELPLFCGAVIKALPHDSVLFHNHLGIGLRYGYPLIQYKTIKGKAAIVCVGKGTESVWDFFARNNFDLTFHDTQECRYQLGMAKAYGFGKCRYNIKLNITAVPQGSQPKDAEFYMARFEDYMSRHVAGPWIQQHPIKGLFTMAGNDVANGGAFDFMTMTNNKDTNEFEKAKTAHEYLQRATSLLPSVVPKTLCDTPDFKAEMEIVRMQEEKSRPRRTDCADRRNWKLSRKTMSKGLLCRVQTRAFLTISRQNSSICALMTRVSKILSPGCLLRLIRSSHRCPKLDSMMPSKQPLWTTSCSRPGLRQV